MGIGKQRRRVGAMLGAMPLIRIVSSAEPPVAGAADALLADLSAVLAREIGKPESYVMTCLEPRARMTFGGTPAPACFAEVMNVGTLAPELTRKLSGALGERLSAALGVPKNRTYIRFVEARGHHWGWDGDTF